MHEYSYPLSTVINVVQFGTFVKNLPVVFLFYRNKREDNISDGVECESDSWSDDSGSDNMSRSLSNNSSKTWDAISEDSSSDQDGSCQKKDKLGYLYLNYTEITSPYMRVPLMEKVTFYSRYHFVAFAFHHLI